MYLRDQRTATARRTTKTTSDNEDDKLYARCERNAMQDEDVMGDTEVNKSGIVQERRERRARGYVVRVVSANHEHGRVWRTWDAVMQ